MNYKICLIIAIFQSSIFAMQAPKKSVRDYLAQMGKSAQLPIQGTKLDLSNLGLTSLDGLTLIPNSAKITSVDLSNNKFTSIDSLDRYILLAMPELSNLNFSNNNIKQIAASAFQGLYNLKSLNLSHNNLESVYTWLANLHNLQSLDLSFNTIKQIETSAFNNLNNFKILNLSNNKLETVGIWLANLHSLQFLDLSSNNITSIVPHAFRDLGNLQTLLLRNNQLSKIDIPAFMGRINTPGRIALKKLNRLDFSGNPLETTREEDQALEDLLPDDTRIITS